MPRSKEFGEALRLARQAAGKTCCDLAIHLGVSVAYVSDVERGEKAPLSVERIEAACALLGADPVALVEAAAYWAEHFRLPWDDGWVKILFALAWRRNAAAAALVLAWNDLEEADVRQIERIARRALKRKGRK